MAKDICSMCGVVFSWRMVEGDEDPPDACPSCEEKCSDHAREMTESSCIGCRTITGYCTCDGPIETIPGQDGTEDQPITYATVDGNTYGIGHPFERALGLFDPNHMSSDDRRESGYSVSAWRLDQVKFRIERWRVNNPK